MEGTMERESGGFFTKSLFFILILVILIYTGINLGMPWLNYYSFKDRLKEIAMYEASEAKEKTMKKIMESAEEKDIPINEEDIKIERTGRKLSIKAKWD